MDDCMSNISLVLLIVWKMPCHVNSLDWFNWELWFRRVAMHGMKSDPTSARHFHSAGYSRSRFYNLTTLSLRIP